MLKPLSSDRSDSKKYQDAIRTLTHFKMAASMSTENLLNLALFMEEVQKYDCL